MSEQVLELEGALTMQTVHRHLSHGHRLVEKGDIVVDFAGVRESDSAALALLLGWLRTARAAGHVLSVRHLPQGLQSLAQLYGVDELLSVVHESGGA